MPGLAGHDMNHYASTLARWDGWELAGQDLGNAEQEAPPDADRHSSRLFVSLPCSGSAANNGGALVLSKSVPLAHSRDERGWRFLADLFGGERFHFYQK